MDEKETDKIKKFNSIYSNNSINKLKVIYSYLPDSSKKGLALYIKLSELLLVMSFKESDYPSFTANEISISKTENHSSDSSPTFNASTFQNLCSELIPYCNASEKSSLQQILDFIKAYDNMQEMLETVKLMQELMPQSEENKTDNTSPFGDMDISQILNVINMMSSDSNK